MRGARAGLFVAALTLALVGGAGCAATGDGDPVDETDGGTSAGPEGQITVYAAASLTNAFEDLGAAFEEEYPGTEVVFNFGGSSGLVTQLQEGAPADVFASADERNMEAASGDGLLSGDASLFATNTLEIAVPPANPAGISSFEDLAAPGIRLVVCAPEVPCGAATERISDSLGVVLQPVSEENAVTDVLGKVASGEADAGIVYRTDVAGAGGDVTGIEIAGAEDDPNRYPIALLAGATNTEGGAAFVEFVLSDEGQAILADYGFGSPAS